ncbi:hypothetical protein RAN53_00540 [Halomonas sp. SSL-5]|uniref:hypothetical protein n=1 Tax=Halomonas sp. SSL-5 TaxID=3065855 RepID=UPI00273930CD|nr:hypothetical protein [Halomonas sp. SSL-5]MDY7114822.1 hypothetical protein [Halomonas sp. SSL-5]
MALSPWHVASRMSCEEVAALLGGYDITAAKAGYIREHHLHELNEWSRVIVEAAQAGEIEPWSIYELAPDPEGGEEVNNAGQLCLGCAWQWRQKEDIGWQMASDDDLKLTFERPEVYRWLKASGVADDDIPEALRVMPKPQAPAAPQNKPLHHKRRQTYLKLIEGLALEVLGGEIPDEPYKVAAMLQTVLEGRGLKLDDEPIAKTVQEILAAREERASDPF